MQLEYLNILLQHFNHVQFCAVNSLSTPACNDFWNWALFLVEAVGLSFFAPILYRAYQNYRGHKSYLKWLVQYEKVADSDVINKLSWKGHAYVNEDFTRHEISEQIRLELEKRRSDFSS